MSYLLSDKHEMIDADIASELGTPKTMQTQIKQKGWMLVVRSLNVGKAPRARIWVLGLEGI